MKKVYVTMKFDEDQKEKLANLFPQYEFIYEEDPDVEIIIGNYKPEELKKFKKLKWIQTSAVGVNNYIKDGNIPDGVILTNAVDVHSKEVAEHIFAVIISMTRKLHLYRDNQRKHEWKDMGGVKEITNLKVCIVGFGDIGKQLALLLKGLGIYVIGVKRTINEKPDYVDELYTNKDLDKAISDADYVVSVLPGNKANEHIFTTETFKQMRKDSIFINAGRGNLYTEETLKEVLDKRIIAGISSDVFESEPLSKDSPLWDYDNFVITPHIAGSYRLRSAKDRLLDLVIENLNRYQSGEELLHIVKERE